MDLYTHNNSVYYTYDSQNQLVKQANDSSAEIKYYYTPHDINYRIDTLFESIDDRDYYSKYISGYDVYGNVVQLKHNSNSSYDESDNRLSKSYFSESYNLTTNYNYDQANKLVSATTSSYDKYNYIYDINGNLVQQTRTYRDNPKTVLAEYGYDSFNRLVLSGTPSTYNTYLYDGNSRRIQKDVITMDSNKEMLKTLQEFWINGRIGFETYHYYNDDMYLPFSYVFDDELIVVTTNHSEKNPAIVDIHGDVVNLLASDSTYNTRFKYYAFGIA